jgi:DNA-binding response OmpR family regulator
VTQPGAPETSRILVIEDEEALRKIIQMQLATADDARYEVRTAPDGISGVAEVRRDPPDLILLDVMMPGMDGYEVCKALKADPLTSRIPIIFLTAKSELNDRLQGLEAFADDYLTKPYEKKELLFRVRNQLKTRRAQLQSNALTGLPGNVLIEMGSKFGFLHIDLDNFKAFNDYYGYARGDDLIRFTAGLLHECILGQGAQGDFVGHIGGDDFVIITMPDRADRIAQWVLAEFDARIASQYDPADRERGRITVHSSRQGGVQDFALLSITILVVTNVARDIQHSAQVSDVAKELKKLGKAHRGSVVVHDRRTVGSPVTPARDGPGPEEP